MEMQGDMEKQNRRKEQEYIKGLKRYEQKGIPVYIDGKKPEEEDFISVSDYTDNMEIIDQAVTDTSQKADDDASATTGNPF